MAIYRLERRFFAENNKNRGNDKFQNDGYKKLRDRIKKLEDSLKEKTEESKKKIPEEIDTKKFLKRAGLGIAGAGVVAGGIYGSYKLGERVDKNREDRKKEKARSRMLRGLNPTTPTYKN